MGVFLNPFLTPPDLDLQIKLARNVINAAVKEKYYLALSTAFLTVHKDAWSNCRPEEFPHLLYSRKSAIEDGVRDAYLKS